MSGYKRISIIVVISISTVALLLPVQRVAEDKKTYNSGNNGRSVIIGFQKTQIYQRFAGSRQEVFILKIQNNENNAAQ